ncbi:selenocysteine lyase, putative [Eimeria tenella]|uniref:Selenocysteine lyase, putative n=1 Tax=Eimeria tenella TaxID=5802 RepID=U6KZL3_EIMTE|nr:selenocysteine lyase, putative [Eimeria tenella]CDJ40910.1 selenocysteine lyase, putative [Eimeria tenella]|eukprot:XP_013231660.1 selenocysteine lyase, putative [Eimeria tenella]
MPLFSSPLASCCCSNCSNCSSSSAAAVAAAQKTDSSSFARAVPRCSSSRGHRLQQQQQQQQQQVEQQQEQQLLLLLLQLVRRPYPGPLLQPAANQQQQQQQQRDSGQQQMQQQQQQQRQQAESEVYRRQNANVHRGAYRLAAAATDAVELKRGSLELDVAAAAALLSPKTRVFAAACVSNVLGSFVQQQQLQQLLLLARSSSSKILTVVDATQALPHTQVQARALCCDVLVGSSHKMYGSSGVGLLWGRKETLELLQPAAFGGQMIQHVGFEDSSFAAPPWRFEAGTLPLAQISGFAAAVDFLNDVGMHNIAAADRVLSKLLMAAVADLPRQQQQHQQSAAAAAAAAAAEETVPICSFTVEGLSPFDLALCADQWHHVHLRAGHHCAQPLHEEVLGVSGSLRASLAVYNTQQDVYRFHDAMIKTIKRIDAVRKTATRNSAAAAAAAAADSAAAAAPRAAAAASKTAS